MAEVLGDDSVCVESGLESDVGDSRSHEQGTRDTKYVTNAAELLALTPTGSPVSVIESPPPETSYSRGERPYTAGAEYFLNYPLKKADYGHRARWSCTRLGSLGEAL
jgi:hypothetical protein